LQCEPLERHDPTGRDVQKPKRWRSRCPLKNGAVRSGPPRRISVLVIEGRPFRSLGDPSVMLSTVVSV
jgi:hypothetical protein